MLLIGALVLFGCGKGSSSSPGQRTSTTTTTSPGHGSGGSGNDNRGGKSSPAPGTAADAAKAKAFARAVNLTAVDLPGFKASAKSQHLTPAERKLEREALGCLGGAGAKHEKGSINVRSQEFEATLGEVTRQAESEVTVVRTPAIAAHQLSIVRGSHARDCLAHFLTLLFGGATAGKAAVSPVHIAEGTPPAPGADGSFAWRVTTTITTRHVPVKIYLDIFGFTRGRAEVQMLTASFLQPFPARVEERLFSLLLERATSHEP
ncbi:MAG TPA: hypothetical protein VGG08_01890 [Solirubrobacteraceae bacterium]